MKVRIKMKPLPMRLFREPEWYGVKIKLVGRYRPLPSLLNDSPEVFAAVYAAK